MLESVGVFTETLGQEVVLRKLQLEEVRCCGRQLLRDGQRWQAIALEPQRVEAWDGHNDRSFVPTFHVVLSFLFVLYAFFKFLREKLSLALFGFDIFYFVDAGRGFEAKFHLAALLEEVR